MVYSHGVAADPGFPGNWDSTTAGLLVRGAWAAAAGDSVLSRRLLATIGKRSAPDLARQGFFGPAMVEACLAARANRWQEVLRLLAPAALQGEARGYVLIQSAPPRWSRKPAWRWRVPKGWRRRHDVRAGPGAARSRMTPFSRTRRVSVELGRWPSLS